MQEIRLLNIEKSFGDKAVLRGLSLTLSPASRSALMGPSGCGKTTLLRILVGLERADAGGVSGLPARIATVFQDDRLCPWLTVEENIRLACPRATKADIQSILSALGLGGEARTKAADLSGGMARRTAIARALLYGGELVVLDEPFRGLDEESRARTAACIRDMTKGKTLLLVTHDAREAALLDARVIDGLFA